MGVRKHSEGDKGHATKYKFNRKAGRSIIEHCPVFSPDGESILLIVENIVRIYNIQTSDCVRILETEAPVKSLVAIQFPAGEDNYNLYGCSDDGRVTTWTWENGAVLREKTLPVPEGMKVLSFNLLDKETCFIMGVRPQDKYVHLGLYSIKTGEQIHRYENHNTLYFEDMMQVSVGWCQSDRFAVICNGSQRVTIQNLTQPHIKNFITNSNLIRVTAVAAHHEESCIAIADALGRAAVYKGNLFAHSHEIGKELLHWHSLPISAACFSMQGTYLYTGGIEKVLVKWTVGNLANKVKEQMFIPRLPGVIRFIATSNTHVAATLSNNSVIIANAQMRVVQTILECGGLSPAARALTCPLVYHQRLGGILMGGRTGHLQLYSTATDKVLYNIDITGMNNLPSERHNLIPVETEVTCAAVSANGSWLVTSEYRNDGITYPEERLKFWALEIKNTTPFKLNTLVNLSHGGCRVVSIALNLRGEFCVTAGADQKFRIWRKEKTTQSSRKVDVWSCLTACYYSSGLAQYLSHGILNNFKIGDLPPSVGEQYPYLRNYQSENDIVRKVFNVHKEHKLFDEDVVNVGIRKDDENDMNGVAISHDGSLIAAWFGCKLTLWDTHLANIKTTLSHPALRPRGIHVQFGNHDAGHFLICTTEKCLAVWSLLSLTVKWLVPIHPTCLAADPLSNKLAVVTQNNDLYVFTPHSSEPVLTRKRLLDPETGVFKQCTFGSTHDDIRIYLTRNDSEVYCLEPEQPSKSLEVLSGRNLPLSKFGALLAEQRLSQVAARAGGGVRQTDTDALGSAAVAQFLSAAPHMVPPISLLCTSFLHLISGQEESEDVEEVEEIIKDGSPSEDEEVNEPSGTYAPKAPQLWTANYEKIKEKRLQRIATEPLLNLHATEAIFGV